MYKLFYRATNVNTEIESQNCFDTRGFITAIECEQVQKRMLFESIESRRLNANIRKTQLKTTVLDLNVLHAIQYSKTESVLIAHVIDSEIDFNIK